MIEDIFLKLLNKEWPSDEELICLIKNYYGDHPHVTDLFEQPTRSRLTVTNSPIEPTPFNSDWIEPIPTGQGLLQQINDYNSLYYNPFTMSDLERVVTEITSH